MTSHKENSRRKALMDEIINHLSKPNIIHKLRLAFSQIDDQRTIREIEPQRINDGMTTITIRYEGQKLDIMAVKVTIVL